MLFVSLPCRSALALSAALAAGGCAIGVNTTSTPVRLDPAALPRVGEVDARYQSYNVEMLEVTGGNFWRPYGAPAAKGPAAADVPAGMAASLYAYRAPIDLANPRLRMLASALAPAYVRVSGTWANNVFFADTNAVPSKPPAGYGGVLTRAQWRGVVDFSRAVGAPIVTSMPTGIGTRDAQGRWLPDQAARWLAFNRAIGGDIAAVEYMNEPTLATMGGAPKGYGAADFERDFEVFRAFMGVQLPGAKILGPGSVGESTGDWGVAQGGYSADMGILPADALAAGMRGQADAFSYHHYGAVSQRCAAQGHQTTADRALGEDWLGRTDQTLAFYRAVRERRLPGKPFWNTETGESACGGNPWAGEFIHTFRYLDQLGRLARQDVKVVLHNTLVASDYSLLDENDFSPKPSYWGALLWARLMGPRVLDSGVPIAEGRHVYAHCLKGTPGGVALLAINNSAQAVALQWAGAPDAQLWQLTAPTLRSRSVLLNGQPLALGADGQLPATPSQPLAGGATTLAAHSISFVALPNAGNAACRVS